jgi:hypothetical protein
MAELHTWGKPRNRLRNVLAIVVGLMIFGHISNAVGLQKCERDVLRRFVDRNKGKEIHLCSDGVDNNLTVTRLEQIKANYRVLGPDEYKKAPFPMCSIRSAMPLAPFLVCVDYGEAEGTLGVWTGRIYLLNFFGLNVMCWRQTDWLS